MYKYEKTTKRFKPHLRTDTHAIVRFRVAVCIHDHHISQGRAASFPSSILFRYPKSEVTLLLHPSCQQASFSFVHSKKCIQPKLHQCCPPGQKFAMTPLQPTPPEDAIRALKLKCQNTTRWTISILLCGNGRRILNEGDPLFGGVGNYEECGEWGIHGQPALPQHQHHHI